MRALLFVLLALGLAGLAGLVWVSIAPEGDELTSAASRPVLSSRSFGISRAVPTMANRPVNSAIAAREASCSVFNSCSGLYWLRPNETKITEA